MTARSQPPQMQTPIKTRSRSAKTSNLESQDNPDLSEGQHDDRNPSHSHLSNRLSEFREYVNTVGDNPSDSDRTDFMQIMETQSLFLLNEMSKMLNEKQETLRVQLEGNIKSSTANVSESISGQLNNISINITSVEDRMISFEANMKSKMSEMGKCMENLTRNSQK